VACRATLAGGAGRLNRAHRPGRAALPAAAGSRRGPGRCRHAGQLAACGLGGAQVITHSARLCASPAAIAPAPAGIAASAWRNASARRQDCRKWWRCWRRIARSAGLASSAIHAGRIFPI
jgi:hypothetical protein